MPPGRAMARRLKGGSVALVRRELGENCAPTVTLKFRRWVWGGGVGWGGCISSSWEAGTNAKETKCVVARAPGTNYY